jgi:hypothetical protein
LGVDIGDVYLDGTGENDPARYFVACGLYSRTYRFAPSSPPSICSLWSTLAKHAFEDQCDYYLLFGDDVEITASELTTTWPEHLHKLFQEMPVASFGCLALHDLGSSGFPTFPIVSRVHLEIFGGDIIPEVFVNQDGDPYLWELYKRWAVRSLSRRFTCEMPLEVRN